MTTLFIVALSVAAVFVVIKGKSTAEEIALAAFTKAKAALIKAITTAQADAKAEVARLEALAAKYL